MMCPLRANGSYCADCYSTCVFYRSTNEQKCLIAQALEVYIAENTRVDNEDETPWEPDWGGVE